jgi:REP element-mobilizing transposase RayT
MALPRSRYMQDGEEGVYHCYCRCVRRAFLCGFDKVTLQDFSHRKAWLIDRLRHLAAIFAIEVCAYAVMDTHYHTILRTRPDAVALWSDQEVAIRWLTLFPQHRSLRNSALPPDEKDIRALTDHPMRITQLRQRLCSLSWFMGQLNEFIARAANKEDKVKGRFWESRFKCQVLLDEAAIASCMVYVDLNPIRADLAKTPEGSDFTSIQQRIHSWRGKMMASTEISAATHEPIPVSAHVANDWLCPIESDEGRRGILPMSTTEYFDLVDKSGQMKRSDKHKSIDADLASIWIRIGARPEAWFETVSGFGSKFHLAGGLVSSLRAFAGRLGRRWFQGTSAARVAFCALPTQPS